MLSTSFVWGQKTVNDTVKNSTKDIEEVVIIGYGKVKKSDLTGSVSSVSAKDLAATPAMNALQALNHCCCYKSPLILKSVEFQTFGNKMLQLFFRYCKGQNKRTFEKSFNSERIVF